MCILCVVQRWSRRVATMLPWLVIPLIILWALSQLLPPGLRFEITSPRLACVVVLLATLFWYEILMPQLSIWRARRSARLRERRRTQAIELQKLRKTATRRCRNCHTPYRDQNPGGGRFMCSYCGHISKRPVLDLPVPAGSSGLISDLKSGWICGQDWTAEPVPKYWINGGGGGGDERCLTEKSYSGVWVFGRTVVCRFIMGLSWISRNVFRVGSREDGLSDGNHKGLGSEKGENGGNLQESRGEKSRRKAEEKRQARLERELLEEEEKKQREEVARLVEERRKLRDEKLEAEKARSKGSGADGERESRKETERRRRDRRREKDKGSSKSNSDGEELEKRAVSRENEKKRDFDKKIENERQKTAVENLRLQVLEGGHGNKVASSKTRYFDRVKGTFLSSSRGFNSASFFGRNVQSPASVNKVSKPVTGFVDHGQNSGIKKDAHSAGHVIGKRTSNGDERFSDASGHHQTVGSDAQPKTTVLKKSWHQLFTRSSAVSPDPDMNTTASIKQNGQLEARSATDQIILPNYSVDNQINFGQLPPFNAYPSANGSLNGKSFSNVAAPAIFPLGKEPGHSSILEDGELFEDPCYVPDPVSLLGPVSESLDNFPLDLGTGFIESNKVEGPRVLRNVMPSVDASKPSPIESPMSRLRGSEERQGSSTPKSQKLHTSNSDESENAHGPGTWQMWGSPLAQDGLGLVGGPSSWFTPLMQNKSNRENAPHCLSHNPIISVITKERHAVPSILTSQKGSVGNHQNGGTFSPLGGPGLNGSDLWANNNPFPSPLPVDGESHFLPHDLMDNIARNEVTYGSPNGSATIHPFEVPPADNWSKEEWTLHGLKEAGNSTPVRPPNIGGLFSTSPDVQSVWSFNHQ